MLTLSHVADAQQYTLPKEAISVIDSLLKEQNIDSTRVRTLLLQKVHYLKKLYSFDEAIKILTNLLTKDTIDLEIMSEIADCHNLNGNTMAALNCYNFLTMNNNDLYFKVQQAGLLYRTEDYLNCISACKNIIATDTIPMIISFMANSYNKTGEKDSAITYYKMLIDIKPDNTNAINNLSNILISDKKYDEVINLTQNYLNINP